MKLLANISSSCTFILKRTSKRTRPTHASMSGSTTPPDIDHAKIVWARDIPGIDIHPLLKYYSDRDVWLVEPDANPPRMTPYKASN